MLNITFEKRGLALFRLIGLALTLYIAFIGFDTAKEWFYGDISPCEAINQTRLAIGSDVLGVDKTDLQIGTATCRSN